MESMNWSKSAGSLARGFSGASFLRRGDENFPCAMVVVSFYRQGIVGAASSGPKADGIARLAEWEQLSARIVGADRIRPQHKAPLRGALCRVDMLVDPYSRAYAVKRVLYEYPRVRADAIRPYSGRRKSWGCTIQRSTLPQSARSGCQLPQRGSQGGCAAAGG